MYRSVINSQEASASWSQDDGNFSGKDSSLTEDTTNRKTSLSSVDGADEKNGAPFYVPPSALHYSSNRVSTYENTPNQSPVKLYDNKAFQKQVFEGGSIYDETLLPDNGLILRTCRSLLDCINKSKTLTIKDGSYSPESFKAFKAFQSVLFCPLVKVFTAMFTLVTVPLAFYGYLPGNNVLEFIKAIHIAWDALLHFSVLPIIFTTVPCALYSAYVADRGHICSKKRDYIDPSEGDENHRQHPSCTIKYCKKLTPNAFAISIILFYSVGVSLTSQFQIIYPSWIWNPFLWGRYRIYRPSDLGSAIDGICLDYVPGDISRTPLCLTEKSWTTLSAEALSSSNIADVRSVMNGISYFHEDSKGLIVNVMSRDTIDAIEPLKKNVEALSKFIPKVSVVIFENDSTDGSRDAFKTWKKEAKGYKVDLIECEDAPDCRYGESHRYDSTESQDYFHSSAIGSMARFRQKMVDYIIAEPEYAVYSHMMVIDLDLGISISPLGVLHSVGLMPDNPIVSAGRQVWPGSFGTLVPPYDFSAFRATVTKRNEWLVSLHKRFCEIMPPGDRWRNQCDAVSPMHLIQVLTHDRSGSDMYRVDSAFNGATLYPLDLIRKTGAQYDVGDDGQRCEHIGFNVGLKKAMYINPKWAMHISPTKPGGPTGTRAMKNVARIVFTPRLSLLIFSQNVGCMIIVVYSFMTLGMFLFYPMICKGWGCQRQRKTSGPGSLPSHHLHCESRISSVTSSEVFDFMHHPIITSSPAPKRKLSDFRVVKNV